MKDLVINVPTQGIGSSPHTGYGDCRNLDIFSIPGIARLNNALAKESVAVVTGLPYWIAIDPETPANVFALDSAGKFYKSTDSGDSWSAVAGNSAGGSGQGLAVWKKYVFVAGDTKLDVYKIADGTWSTDWTTTALDSATWHPMLVSKNDGKLYIGSGRYVLSVEELAGQTFAPGTSTTYDFNDKDDPALDLPANYKVKCLAELGNNLMVGTWMGTNVYDIRVADIFPWDRSSSSFNQPVQLAENGINAMITVGSYLYIQAGIDGKIYKSDGAGAVPIAQIPVSIANLDGGKYLEGYPGAIANYKGRPFFGVSEGGTDNTIAGMGVYSLMETSKGTILVHEHTISTGEDGSTTNVKIGALCPTTRDRILVGWKDGTSYGIDRTDIDDYQTSYTGYFESPVYQVGTHLNQATFTQLEFLLADNLASDEGIKIDYRTDLGGGYTNIGTYDYATYGAIKSLNVEPEIPSCEILQLKVYLTGDASTPMLRSITLR